MITAFSRRKAAMVLLALLLAVPAAVLLSALLPSGPQPLQRPAAVTPSPLAAEPGDSEPLDEQDSSSEELLDFDEFLDADGASSEVWMSTSDTLSAQAQLPAYSMRTPLSQQWPSLFSAAQSGDALAALYVGRHLLRCRRIKAMAPEQVDAMAVDRALRAGRRNAEVDVEALALRIVERNEQANAECAVIPEEEADRVWYWWSRAATLGDDNALSSLGMIAFAEYRSVEDALQRAEEIVERRAQLMDILHGRVRAGNPGALFALADLYASGHSVAPDAEEAGAWYAAWKRSGHRLHRGLRREERRLAELMRNMEPMQRFEIEDRGRVIHQRCCAD